MDLMNNLVFTALNTVGGFSPLTPRFFALRSPLAANMQPTKPAVSNYYRYDIDVIEEFSASDDSDFIDSAIQKHWADMVTKRNYFDSANPANVYSIFDNPPYHLIYAYLVENTRIAQIMEKLIALYTQDEKLKKATAAAPDIRRAFQWIGNTETLFFKSLPTNSYRNITSQVRVSDEATRRNVYFRMFGMDLAFGDINSNSPVNFIKAEFNNQPFIVLFEKFLSEIWQGYINAQNQTGVNTTDMFEVVDTAQKIQEMLMSRRTTDNNFSNYQYSNLTREEFASVVAMSWFFEVVTYNSPLVEFLRCNGNTPGERLINIGNKVGLPAHSKSEGLLDIAPPMNTLLRRIELGDYNAEPDVTKIIKSQFNNLPATDPSRQALNDLLLIINNWEKATGHRIKNPAAKLNGTVQIDQKASVAAAVSAN